MLVWGSKEAMGSIINLLKIYKELGCKGVGEVCGSIPVDDDRYGVIFDAAGELDMPLIFHIQRPGGHSYGVFDNFHLTGFEKMLQKYPKTVFIGHSMAFWSEISGEVELADREKYLKAPYEKKGRLWELFEKYPNVCVDLTPGWEMYLSFYADKNFFKDFFTKYSKRIVLGTDAYFPRPTECSNWLVDRVYRFISSPDVVKAVADRYESGLCIPDSAIEDISYKNFERRVSVSPKPIDKVALRAYYEKYKHKMIPKDIALVEGAFARYQI